MSSFTKTKPNYNKLNNTNNTNANKTNSLDIDKLEKALDNNSNENIINFTTEKIKEMNWKIIQELKLDKLAALDYLGKLKGYKYVDELTDLKHGGFVRWIPITDPDYLPLNQCGIVCDIKIGDEGVFITCKNFMHRHYNFKMDDVIIFQKLTSQELVILSALDHLNDDLATNLEEEVLSKAENLEEAVLSKAENLEEEVLSKAENLEEEATLEDDDKIGNLEDANEIDY
jgi:hypothetical protein